jgi:hypothetical protein
LSTPSPEPQIVETPSIFETTLLTSSPPDATVLHSATTALNQLAMNGELFNTPVSTLVHFSFNKSYGMTCSEGFNP